MPTTVTDPYIAPDGTRKTDRTRVVADEELNAATLRDQAAQALATNRTFTAIASPSTAQVTAQVKALTRQNNGIIRLLLGQLDGTD